MPALKWERVRVIETEQGISTDRPQPGLGSPILLVQNGHIGADGTPWQRRTSLGFISDQGWGGTRPWVTGAGGVVTGENTRRNDSNGNASVMRIGASGALNYAIYRGATAALLSLASLSFTSYLDPDPIPVPGVAGLNLKRSAASMFSNPFSGIMATSPVVVGAIPPNGVAQCVNGIPSLDVVVQAVVAKQALQLAGTTYATGGNNYGSFILYQNATNWFLTKVVQRDVTGLGGSVSVDPAPLVGFNTVSIARFDVWGGTDSTIGTSGTLAPHVSGTEGAYLASQCAEFFQGRVLFANVIFAPQYTVAADINDVNKYVQKSNRLCWTILPGEKPTRGPFTTNSDGLTHLQFPWSVEVNNFIDVDGVGNIYSLSNLGDNQVFIIGSDGCARLTGYLATSVSGVNSATYDVRPILRSPGGYKPGCSVVTSKGVFYTDGNSIYQYDGNAITDVLYGVARFTLPNRFDGNCGVLDNDYIYFSAFGQILIFNVNSRKWSVMAGIGNPGDTVVKGTFYSQTALNATTGSLRSVGTTFQQSPVSRSWLTDAEQGPGIGFAPWGRVGEDYVVALRGIGSPGIPKRFRHIIVNYGFVPDLGGVNNVCTVKALYGADRGWPNAMSAAVTIGTLPFTWSPTVPLNNLGTGSLPTKSIRFSLDDTTLTNYFADGTLTKGYPDQIQLIFTLAYDVPNVSGAYLKIHSVDVSYFEVPQGHVVMGAA